VAARAVSAGDEIVVTSSDGVVIRQSVDDISRQKRDTTGVRVMSLPADASLSAVALVAREEIDDLDEVDEV